MESQRKTKRCLVVVMLCVSWIVGCVGATSPLDANLRSNSSSHHHHDHEGTYNRLRSSTASAPSLSDTESDMLNDLKDIVFLLTQKIDDLEVKVQAQDATIKNLKIEVNDATSFHRYLQSDDSDCLPRFRNTTFGPRCDFQYVTRFQNRTFFNEDVVFNENVEFDSDANCLPTFNATTRMCQYNNNFTFGEGDVQFDYDVRFTDTVKFDDDASFRDNVQFRSDVDFTNNGEVNFKKHVKFSEDVLIKNEDHDIDFKLEDRVKAKFYQDRTFEVDTHTTFYEDVSLEKDLDVDGKLEVHKKTKLDDLELYGYLWVDGFTQLEGELRANHHANVKGGLSVESGGLDVKQHGATVVGDTNVRGTFRLHGDGYVDQNFNVDAKLTTTQLLVDGVSRRNLQSFSHPIPAPTPPPPVLEVRGDTNIDGTLFANKIRSDDINDKEIDINQIVNLIKVELREASVVFGDVNIINNLIQEKVLTESRMLDLMKSANLVVDKVTANSAVIGGKAVPEADDPVTAELVLALLRNQNLSVNSITANSATVEKLQGKDLRVSSIDSDSMNSNAATIGGQSYPHSATKIDLDDIVDQLKVYNGEITIPNLVSVKIDVINALTPDEVIPAVLRVDGKNVVTSDEIIDLDERINGIGSSIVDDSRSTMSQDEIVATLRGAALTLNSLEASSIMKGTTELTTMDDVSTMIGEATSDIGSSPSTCTCDSTVIESVVTSDFVQGKISGDYIASLGFVTETTGGDCTCTESDVQANVDVSYLESLGVSFSSGEPQSCTCSSEDIQQVVDNSYIEDVVTNMGVSIGESEATCTCSEDLISAVVTRDYVADMGFIDESPECSCDVENSQIESVITKDYISAFGFLDTCPCDTFVWDEGE